MKTLNSSMNKIYDKDAPFSSDIIANETINLKRTLSFISVLLIFTISAVTIVAISLAFVTNRPPITLSYTSDEYGRVVEIKPVEQPYSVGRITGFATETVMSSLHLSFTDYEDHLLGLAKRFTPDGFKAFQQGLVDKDWISKIENDNLTMWIEVRTAPKYLEKGLVGGVYEYELVFDVDLFIGGGDKTYNPTRLQVNLIVIRTTSNLDGLIIKRILLLEKK
jgi:hypothetical protein